MTRLSTPTRIACLTLLLAGIVTAKVSAHHGTGVSYDSSKKVTITGKVTEFAFRNPHSALFIEGSDDKGQATKWAIEMSSPGVMMRAGWNRKTFVPGDMVSIVVNPSRAGTPIGVCLNPCTVTVNGKALSAREN